MKANLEAPTTPSASGKGYWEVQRVRSGVGDG